MTEAVMTHTQEVADVQPPVTFHQPPDLNTIAERAVTQAVEYCAHKMSLGSTSEALRAIQEGNRSACAYCLYALSKQIAESIGTLDGTVKAIYTLDYDATPEDLCFGSAAPGTSLVHLVVWTERKTAALGSLAAALDRAVVQIYGSVLGWGERASMLDVQLIDDQEVQDQVGYGALLASIHHPPIQIWQRGL
jgi:hypothetical protein